LTCAVKFAGSAAEPPVFLRFSIRTWTDIVYLERVLASKKGCGLAELLVEKTSGLCR
jgi:hypothetical protein